ncbi:MAG: polysaccharide biosynthesis C-terminal domain-containing protein, partial [Rhodospirillales bacterium]|nr:polysaccharide biosynthesis C-terminal domain-containing protein [Rhodospirillales bacterium]
MHTLFAHGAFSDADAARSAAALAVYAFGLPAFVLVKLFAPGFFARGDTSTPVKTGLAAVAINLALNLALMHPLQQVGIALSTSLAAWFNALALALLLRRRADFAPDRALARRILAIALASGLMALALLALRRTALMHLAPVASLALLIAAGLAVFALAGILLGAIRPAELRLLLRRPKPA